MPLGGRYRMDEARVRRIVDILTRPIKTKVAMLAARVVIATVDDSKKMQLVNFQALKNEDLTDVERFQNAGFTSNPGPDCEGVILCFGGSRDHAVVIAAENRDRRPTGLKDFESMMYYDKKNYIKCLEGGKFEIKNSKYEYMKLFADLVQAIIDGRTATATGPQPLLNPKDPFTAILKRAKTFVKG